MILKIILALYLILHGGIHILGFLANFDLLKWDEITYSTRVLMGRIDLGYVGIRLLGIVWLIVMVMYIVAGIAVFSMPDWWLNLTLLATGLSMVLCILGLPDTRIGILANLVLLGFLYLDNRNNWLN
jgi:hypothetical protein